jgi:hypothetical protein
MEIEGHKPDKMKNKFMTAITYCFLSVFFMLMWPHLQALHCTCVEVKENTCRRSTTTFQATTPAKLNFGKKCNKRQKLSKVLVGHANKSYMKIDS